MKRRSPKLNNKILTRGTNTKIIQKTTYESPSYRVHKYLHTSNISIVFLLYFHETFPFRKSLCGSRVMPLYAEKPLPWTFLCTGNIFGCDVWIYLPNTSYPSPPPPRSKDECTWRFLTCVWSQWNISFIGALVSSKVWRKRNGVCKGSYNNKIYVQ
jgi:hypothetical protein